MRCWQQFSLRGINRNYRNTWQTIIISQITKIAIAVFLVFRTVPHYLLWKLQRKKILGHCKNQYSKRLSRKTKCIA